jgi:hypothetical protein
MTPQSALERMHTHTASLLAGKGREEKRKREKCDTLSSVTRKSIILCDTNGLDE